jgi:hypothetical protein
MISDLDLGQTTESQVHGSRFLGERGDRVADKPFEVIPLIRWVLWRTRYRKDANTRRSVSCGMLAAALRSCVTLCSWLCSRSPTNIRRSALILWPS